MQESIYYIAVDRDDAKQLFATKEPAELRALANRWIEENSAGAANKFLKLDNEWELLRQKFGPNTDDMPPALASVMSGSRKLVEQDDFSIHVIRPDMIAILAGELTKITAAEHANDRALRPFQQLFAGAAENRAAVAIIRVNAASTS